MALIGIVWLSTGQQLAIYRSSFIAVQTAHVAFEGLMARAFSMNPKPALYFYDGPELPLCSDIPRLFFRSLTSVSSGTLCTPLLWLLRRTVFSTLLTCIAALVSSAVLLFVCLLANNFRTAPASSNVVIHPHSFLVIPIISRKPYLEIREVLRIYNHLHSK